MVDKPNPLSDLPGRKLATGLEIRNDARQIFLQMIETEAPEVLRSLEMSVLPAFEPDGDVDDIWAWGTPDQNPAFRAAVDAWAEKFNLQEDWLVSQAELTTRVWDLARARPERASEIVGRTFWWYDSWASPPFFSPDELKFSIQLDPLHEDRTTARQRVLAELGKRLDDLELRAAERQLEEPPNSSRLKKRAENDDHRWLIAFQLHNKTQSEIAGHSGVTAQNVSDAIGRLSELLPLKLRQQHRPGVPAELSERQKESLERMRKALPPE